jgi:hypothetical protein
MGPNSMHRAPAKGGHWVHHKGTREVAMNWSRRFAWFPALRARCVPTRPGPCDPAEMGTAYGLDASFGAGTGDPPARPSDPAGPDARPWADRLTRRSSL